MHWEKKKVLEVITVYEQSRGSEYFLKKKKKNYQNIFVTKKIEKKIRVYLLLFFLCCNETLTA